MTSLSQKAKIGAPIQCPNLLLPKTMGTTDLLLEPNKITKLFHHDTHEHSSQRTLYLKMYIHETHLVGESSKYHTTLGTIMYQLNQLSMI